MNVAMADTQTPIAKETRSQSRLTLFMEWFGKLKQAGHNQGIWIGNPTLDEIERLHL